MPIPEDQLEIWSHQGTVTTAKLTHEYIRNALNSDNSLIREKEFSIYLQGSYVNVTNIRSDSDVDVIVQLDSSWYRDISQLPPQDQQSYRSSHLDATYTEREFRLDVIKSLQSYFGTQMIKLGNKSTKLLPSSGRLAADIVTCSQYRRYLFFHGLGDEQYVQGIGFYAQDGRLIVHFPKQHQQNGEDKNAKTNGLFKPTVRVFKNIRTYLVDRNVINSGLSPSYFLECMLYNVPSDEFENSYGETFCNAVNWLQKQDLGGFVSQSEQSMLFGTSPDNWSVDNANAFLSAAIKLWNEWK